MDDQSPYNREVPLIDFIYQIKFNLDNFLNLTLCLQFLQIVDFKSFRLDIEP